MSSGLSGTCQTAAMLSDDYDGKVQVVNNQRISVTMRQSVLDAKLLVSKGYSAAQIKEVLEREKMQSSIYITLETLKIFKEGRTNHTGGSGNRNGIKFKACIADSGREAGRIF